MIYSDFREYNTGPGSPAPYYYNRKREQNKADDKQKQNGEGAGFKVHTLSIPSF